MRGRKGKEETGGRGRRRREEGEEREGRGVKEGWKKDWGSEGIGE